MVDEIELILKGGFLPLSFCGPPIALFSWFRGRREGREDEVEGEDGWVFVYVQYVCLCVCMYSLFSLIPTNLNIPHTKFLLSTKLPTIQAIT